MKEKPLVTIVTITFNLIKAGREKYFRQCLESVHNQTYENIEHIIIDGASKDGTLDLIQEYADRGWIKYMSESDSGIYDAMNKGVIMAKGKYIAFLNSDDFYHNEQGVYLSVKLLEDSGADFSYAPVRMLYEDGSILNWDHPHRFPNIKNVFFVMPFSHQTMLTKKDVIVRENMFNKNFKSAGDYDFLIRLCLSNSKSVLVKDEFVSFRFGGLSDANREQSIREVSQSYFNNYNKLTHITKEECDKIYCTNFSNIPDQLAEKFKCFDSYFDYIDFVKINKPDLNKKIINILYTIKAVAQGILLGSKRYFKPTRSDVIDAYGCFLGRKPENEFVILEYMKQNTVGDVIDLFKNSKEFHSRKNMRVGLMSRHSSFEKIKKIIPRGLRPYFKNIYRKLILN